MSPKKIASQDHITPKQLPVQLSTSDQTAIQQFLLSLQEKYGHLVEAVILFGSKARGDDHPDSDIDLLVLTEIENWSIRNEIWRMAARLELSYEVIFNIQIIASQRWQSMGEGHFSLHQRVSQEGICLTP
jgi:predicted nucleotidyltransferase